MKIKFKLIYVPIIFSILFCILMVGITDYISAGFTIKNLIKPDFWINLTLTTLGNVSIITAIILINVDKFTSNDEVYNVMKNRIIEFRKTKYVAPLFTKFCNESNRKTKIIYYKNKIEKKFTKLKPTLNDLDIFNGGTDEEKANNKYCRTVRYYNELLKPEYIEKNIDKIKIKYPKISSSLIFSGYKNENNLVDYVTKNKVKKVTVDYLPKFLISFSITVLLMSMAPTLKENISIATILNTLARLFAVTIQIYFAKDYSTRYNSEVTLHDIQYRESKINEYIVWEDKQIKLLNTEKEVDN